MSAGYSCIRQQHAARTAATALGGVALGMALGIGDA